MRVEATEKACLWAPVDSRRGVPWWALREREGDAFRCCYGLRSSWRRELPHLANAAQEGRPRTRRFLCGWVRHEMLQSVLCPKEAYPPMVLQLDVGGKKKGDRVAGGMGLA